jgi:hypothetical protein
MAQLVSFLVTLVCAICVFAADQVLPQWENDVEHWYIVKLNGMKAGFMRTIMMKDAATGTIKSSEKMRARVRVQSRSDMFIWTNVLYVVTFVKKDKMSTSRMEVLNNQFAFAGWSRQWPRGVGDWRVE